MSRAEQSRAEQSRAEQSRVKWIDALRGFGIILVILGHAYGINDNVYKLIYSFHMPLFFIISGFLFNSNKWISMSFFQFVKDRLKKYILPYFLYCFINLALLSFCKIFLLKESIGFNFYIKSILSIFCCFSKTDFMPNCTPLWFLMCLFWSSIFFWFILKYGKKYIFLINIVLLICGYCLSIFITKIFNFNVYFLPLKLPTATIGTVMIFVGYVIRQYDFLALVDKLPQIKRLGVVLSLLVIGILGAYLNTGVGMNENTYGILPYFMLSSCCIPFSLMYLFSNLNTLNNKLFVLLGISTIPIMGLSYFFRDLANEIYYLIPVLKNYKISWFPSFLITLLITFVFILFYNYIKSKRLIFNKSVKLK